MERPIRPRAGLDGTAGVGARGGGPGAWTARLERWAAEARVDEAARARSRERSLRRQAEEGATLAGVLADLAEGAGSVRVQLRGGRGVAGIVRAVGDDVVVLEPVGAGAGPAVVALSALTAVRAGPGTRAVTGDRRVGSGLRLIDVVAELAAEREQVRVLTVDGEAVPGRLRSLGRDVVAVSADPGAAGGAAYVPLAALAAVLVGG